MNKAVVEFLGVFFLALIVSVSYLDVQLQSRGPFGVSAILVVMTLMAFSRSGAHFNPLVTLSFWSRRMMSYSDATVYISAQFLGGVSAVLVASLLVPHESLSETGMNEATIFLVEFLFSFLYVLTFLILGSKVSKSGELKGGLERCMIQGVILSLALGLVVFCSRMLFWKYSAIALNPVLLFVLLLTRVIPEHFAFPYLIAQILATFAALLVLHTISGEEDLNCLLSK